MNKELLFLVILRASGKVSIATQSKQTVFCTPTVLLSMLSSPHEFNNTYRTKYKITTPSVNPYVYPLEKIPGLTLIKVYTDGTFECRFPKIFEALLSATPSSTEEEIDLASLILTTKFDDEKHFLMKFFYDFTHSDVSELSVNHQVGISLDERNEIMRETFNTLFSAVEHKQLPKTILFKKTNRNRIYYFRNAKTM